MGFCGSTVPDASAWKETSIRRTRAPSSSFFWFLAFAAGRLPAAAKGGCGIAKALDEAADIDGAGKWRVFTDVILPLARPGLIALALITFIFQYQQFFWPLIMLDDQQFFPLPVGLLELDSTYGRQTELIMAAALCVVFR